MKPQRYRKKPVVIEAFQFRQNNANDEMDEIVEWIESHGGKASHNGTDILIETLEGTMTANRLDWIIKGVKGEFYPCKPEIFAASYEAA